MSDNYIKLYGNIPQKDGIHKNNQLLLEIPHENYNQFKCIYDNETILYNRYDNYIPNTGNFNKKNDILPKIIHQIFWDFSGKERKIEEITEYNACSQSWKKNHSDWEYKLWYGPEMHKFVEDNFPKYYEKWNKLPKKIMKVDSFRYMLMYKIGGIYSDLDQESLVSFDKFYEENKVYDIVLFCDNHPSCHNGLLISKPNKIFWVKFLDRIFKDENNTDILNLTGPPALYNFYKDYTKGNVNIENIKTFYPREDKNDQHYLMRRGDGSNSCSSKVEGYNNDNNHLIANWDKTPTEIHWLRGNID